MNEYDDILKQLFGFRLPEEQESYQAQAPPQLQQGLLGDTSGTKDLLQQLVPRRSTDTAAQMAQVAQQMANQGSNNNTLAQRQAAASQIGQQALAQQERQQQQSMELIMKLAQMFAGTGG